MVVLFCLQAVRMAKVVEQKSFLYRSLAFAQDEMLV